MESFDLEAASLACFSTVNPETLTVTAEFMEDDNFLDDEVEAEFGNDADSGSVIPVVMIL